MKNKQVKAFVCVLLATHGIQVLAADVANSTKNSSQASATVKLKTFKPASNAVNQPNIANLQELPPGTIQTIQFIGRSVLAAKHSEVADPNAAQVKAHLESLRQNLDEVIKADAALTPSTSVNNNPSAVITTDTASSLKSKINSPFNNNPTIKLETQKASTENDAERRKQHELDQKTNNLHQRLSEIKTDNQQRRQALTERPESEHQPHMRHLLDKSQTISDEIDVALADKSPERMAKLMQLRDRLTVKTQGEIQPAKPIAQETPTISTITRHRE